MSTSKSKKTSTSSKEIKCLQKQISDLEEKLKRTLADYKNQDRRYQSRQSEVVLYANQKLLDKILPLLDSLQIAQDHLHDKGISLIIDQFHQILASEEVKPISSDHQPFDPQTMDCSTVVPGDKNIVTNTLSRGYTYRGRVLRPAKVEVGSGKKK